MNYIKTLKFVIIAVIMSICIFLPSELFQLYLPQFDSNMLHTTFVSGKDTGNDEMNRELLKAAKKNNILIFKAEKKTVSPFESEIVIYADKEAREYLKKNCGVYDKCFGSLLSGKTTVSIYPFVEAPASEKGDKYTLIGDEDDAYRFKQMLVDKYGGSFPKVVGINEKKEMTVICASAWAMAVLLCCLITAYECACKKKETFVRMSLGENVNRLILKNIFTDSAAVAIWFFLMRFAVVLITKTRFLTALSYGVCVLLILLNSLIYLRLRPKGAASLTGYEKSSEKQLSFNYFLKAVCVALTCLIVSGNIASIGEGINYYRQKSFFEEYKDYYAYNCFKVGDDSSDDEAVDAALKKLYRSFCDEMKIFYLCNTQTVDGRSIAEANYNAKEYLSGKIKEFSSVDFSKCEHCVFAHKDEKLSEERLRELGENMNFYSENEIEKCEIVYYEDNVALVTRSLNSEPDTTLVKNPVILFSNSKDDIPYEMYLCLMKTDKAKLNSFSGENDLTYSETNVFDYFNQKMLTYKRLVYVNSVLSAVIMLLEFLVTLTVIRLEYSVNAVSLAVKKVVGYSNYDRFSHLYRVIILLWVLSTAVAVTLSRILQFGNSLYVIFGAAVILGFDLVVIYANIRSYDRKNIQKILKGGAL